MNPAGFARGEVIAIRPGVVLPDWRLVPDATGQEALAASMAVAGRRVRWAGISPAEDQVWRAVLRCFAAHARTPDASALMGATGSGAAMLHDLLRSLSERDLLMLDAAGSILAAYPFSAAPTRHLVELSEGRSVHALCAIDALGIGGMLGQDTVIRTACPYCGARIRVETCGGGRGIAAVRPDGAMVWSGIAYAGRCAATSGCVEKLFFCSEAHFALWHAGRAVQHGFRLPLAVAQQVGLALFVPMLDPGLQSTPRT